MFAAVIMMILGVFHAFWGLTGIIKDNFFVASPNQLINIDVTAWGWIHMILGIVVFVAGYSLLSGAVWARTVGVILASLSAIGNFVTIPEYPFWAIVMLTLDIFVIWALTVHGRDVAAGPTG
jgi:hypothetical protein